MPGWDTRPWILLVFLPLLFVAAACSTPVQQQQGSIQPSSPEFVSEVPASSTMEPSLATSSPSDSRESLDSSMTLDWLTDDAEPLSMVGTDETYGVFASSGDLTLATSIREDKLILHSFDENGRQLGEATPAPSVVRCGIRIIDGEGARVVWTYYFTEPAQGVKGPKTKLRLIGLYADLSTAWAFDIAVLDYEPDCSRGPILDTISRGGIVLVDPLGVSLGKYQQGLVYFFDLSSASVPQDLDDLAFTTVAGEAAAVGGCFMVIPSQGKPYLINAATDREKQFVNTDLSPASLYAVARQFEATPDGMIFGFTRSGDELVESLGFGGMGRTVLYRFNCATGTVDWASDLHPRGVSYIGLINPGISLVDADEGRFAGIFHTTGEPDTLKVFSLVSGELLWSRSGIDQICAGGRNSMVVKVNAQLALLEFSTGEQLSYNPQLKGCPSGVLDGVGFYSDGAIFQMVKDPSPSVLALYKHD